MGGGSAKLAVLNVQDEGAAAGSDAQQVERRAEKPQTVPEFIFFRSWYIYCLTFETAFTTPDV